MAAEAVVFFDPSKAEGMQSRRKRGAQLLSKHRFIAAQFEAYLQDGLWLALARHANDAADTLAARLAEAGIDPVWRVEANEVFVALPKAIDARLRGAGASYYPWTTNSLAKSAVPDGDHILVRLVTSFATTETEIDRFAALLRRG
jgi:threonine aldolase